jgi:hypothetical protein
MLNKLEQRIADLEAGFQVYWSVVAGHGLYSRPRRVVGRQHVALPRTHEVKAWYGPRVHALREAWSRREDWRQAMTREEAIFWYGFYGIEWRKTDDVDRALDEADIKLAGAPEERASAIMQALYTELEM